MIRSLGLLLALVQGGLAGRVVWRLLRTGREGPIRETRRTPAQPGALAVIVPVLNEVTRLSACLDGLLAHGHEVGEIVVVDGGSSDGTPDLVREYARRDDRLRLLEAGPSPHGWNGKVWGLAEGERAVSPRARWLLTLDADVRPAPYLARSLLAQADARGLQMLSVATAQRLSGAVEGALHPALLATLVYRFGRPGGATRSSNSVMANGQCCLIQRDLLRQLGGFETVRDSLCEDVTLARLAARAGALVGFYETEALVEVAMYAGWRDAWANWPRSLATRDALFGLAGWVGLIEVALVQALPLPLLVLGWPAGTARSLNRALFMLRIGMLVGIARAYPERPFTYWLSPLLDVSAAFALWRSALRSHHVWRGHTYLRDKGMIVAA